MSAGFQIQYEITDLSVTRKLQDLIAKAGNLTPAMRKIGQYMLRQTNVERFGKQKDPEGKKWLNLKDKTWKKKKKPVILTEEGTLKSNQNFKAESLSVSIGTTEGPVYAAIHQFGGEAGKNHKVKIPARPFLGFNEENKKMAIEKIRIFLGDK
jgi:phage virion morphogenesis protein